ncbi:MAG: DUF3750 domain-containing protein [Kofleriaceae bacterium]
MRLPLLALLAGCSVFPRSLDKPTDDNTYVALLTGSLGHPLDGIARHPWFAVHHKGDANWHVYEVGGGGEEADPFRKHSEYLNPQLEKMWSGEEAERAAECIERVGPAVRNWIQDHYIFYPGPNSNTFGDVVLRRCHLHASLPSTSVGKDWRGWIGGGVTSEGTGLQLETPVIGVKVGLKEGVEVHIIGLSFGIDLWPPALIVPWGSGRLGFADR